MRTQSLSKEFFNRRNFYIFHITLINNAINTSHKELAEKDIKIFSRILVQLKNSPYICIRKRGKLSSNVKAKAKGWPVRLSVRTQDFHS